MTAEMFTFLFATMGDFEQDCVANMENLLIYLKMSNRYYIHPNLVNYYLHYYFKRKLLKKKSHLFKIGDALGLLSLCLLVQTKLSEKKIIIETS